MKNDKGKLRPTLLSMKAIKRLLRVLEFGAKKYERDNWKLVEPQRYKDALARHFMEYLEDERSIDEESGLPHIYHVMANAMFLCDFHREQPVEQPKGKVYYEGVPVTPIVTVVEKVEAGLNQYVCLRCMRLSRLDSGESECPVCQAKIAGVLSRSNPWNEIKTVDEEKENLPFENTPVVFTDGTDFYYNEIKSVKGRVEFKNKQGKKLEDMTAWLSCKEKVD